jgi:hypothetical protein
MQYRNISVERSTPIFLKKRFHFCWRMCFYVCVRAFGFNTTVPLPVLHVECAIEMPSLETVANMKMFNYMFCSKEVLGEIISPPKSP